MARPRKYSTIEEAYEAKKEYNRKRYYEKKDEILERHFQRKEEIAQYMRQWRKENKEYISEYNKQWVKDNPEYHNGYNSTPLGRAIRLAASYRQKDIEHNRGESTITAKWIVENIFSKPCHYCGKTDWRKLGCDRIDNNKPHTPDNVVPCCAECNLKRGTKEYEDFIMEITVGQK